MELRRALWPECPEHRHLLEMEQSLRSQGIVLFAEDPGGQAIGFAEVSIHRDHVEGASSAPVPYLEAWYVIPDRRGQGIGRALIASAAEWALGAGFSELASDAESGQIDTIQAHLALGFREVGSSVHFLRPLRSSQAEPIAPRNGPSGCRLAIREPPMTIETATRADAEDILRLQRLAYRNEAELYQDWTIPPLTESLEQLLAEFDRQLFLKAVGEQPRQLVGSVRARCEGDACFIGRLIVHPDFQRRGIGSRLMGEVERRFPQARRFELFTGHRSAGNLSLYRRLGYTPFREQRLSEQVTLIYLQKFDAETQRAQSNAGRIEVADPQQGLY